MNLAKKIFVVLLAATLLVSCFALFASAEVSKPTVDNLDALFEYHYYKDNKDSNGVNGFFQSDYEAYFGDSDDNAKLYYPDSRLPKLANKPLNNYTKYTVYVKSGNSTVITDPDNSDNNILFYKKLEEKISNGDLLFKYKIGNDAETAPRLTDKLVVTFDVKLGGEAGFVEISAQNNTYFRMDLSNSENPAFEYVAYKEGLSDEAFERKMEGLTPEFDKWYTVEAIMNFAGNELTIDVFEKYNPENKATTGKVMFAKDACDVVDSTGAVGPRFVEISVTTVQDKHTEVSFDDLYVYEGTAVRDIVEPDKAINSFLAEVDEVANDPDTPASKKVEIAEFYEKLFYDQEIGMLYVPDAEKDSPENVAKVNAIKNGAKEYLNRAYAQALIEYADTLKNDTTIRYYDRIEIFDAATVFYNFFYQEGYKDFFDYTAGDFSEITEFAGVDVAAKEAIEAAVQIYLAEPQKREDIKNASIGFVDHVFLFDYENKNYKYTCDKVVEFDRFAERDETFKYAEEVGITDPTHPKYKYQTVANALEEYYAIKLTIAEIDANAIVFSNAVRSMEALPQKTKNFTALCDSYSKASSVFANGTVHESLLDVTSYNKEPLVYYITIYNERGAYIASRINECNEFINLINSASASVAYNGTLSYLDAAAFYIDENVEDKSVETEYPGVNEAIATYNALREKLAGDIVKADAYKAAVNAIDINAPYAALKASVEAALALKETGAVVGVDGVEAANIKLTEAETKVGVLEGHSTTLITSVNAIKNAKTLAERRELIFIATNAAAGAEDSIAGVTAAKAALAEATKQFNADVDAANSGFFASARTAADASASVSASENTYKLADIIKALLK